jgi:phenylacetate-CoA ligase
MRYQIRYGEVFRNTYAFLQKSEYWSREKLEKHQLLQLRKLLYHAYENVPYYRSVFDERRLSPDDVKTLDDLRKLPYLTREIIRDNLKNLVARNYSESKLRFITTGGSTGVPLGFYRDERECGIKEGAFITNMWHRVGYKLEDKCVVFSGHVVRSAEKGKFWEYDLLNNRVFFSSYHMTDKNLPRYIEEIRRIKPDFIHGYPSVIAILARFMKENSIEPFPSVKAVLCGSENIYQPQRDLLEEVFNCRAFSWYGHTEQAVLAGECECSTCYHIFSQYGITELIGKDGELVTDEDDVGEVVATGFINYAMPFIRYKTMDLGVHTCQRCECGREYPLLKRVEGRLQDLIVTKDGGLISLTALIFGQHFHAFSRIKDMQIEQERKGEITMRIVKARGYSDKNEKEMFQRIQEITGNQLHVQFEYVDEIPRTRMGKRLFLIQKLPIKWAYTG